MTDPEPGASRDYRDGDLPLQGELFRPAAAPDGRAVLIFHEADGIGSNVRGHAARLADLGYIAFAADMHGAGRLLKGDEVQDALASFRGDPAYTRCRAQAALDAMLAIEGVDNRRVAAIGFCFGGYCVLELARSGAPIAVAASFHGLLTTARLAEPGQVSARVAAFTGALDPLVPPEDVAAFQAEMMAAGADWRMTVYGRALHSFTNEAVDARNDPRMRYDAAVHADSWAALIDLLDASLPPP